MSEIRKPLFAVTTPFPGVPQVTLFQDTWSSHIIKQHVYMEGKEALVQTVAESPTLVAVGTSNPGYLIYVNEEVTTPKGTPLAVIVDPQEKVICTAYYNRSLKIIVPEQVQVVWLRSETK